MLGVKGEFNPEAKEQLFEGFSQLNDFLTGNKWVTGDNLTIADFSIIGTVATYFVRFL